MVNLQSVPTHIDEYRLLRIPCCMGIYDRQNIRLLKLNDTSAEIWDACDGIRSIDDIIQFFAKTYADASSDELQREIIAAIGQFESKKVISLQQQK